MDTDGGGWTVFQRRQSDAVSFNRSWDEYKNGFGSLDGDFWWGNERLAQALNNGRQYELRIDMIDWDYEPLYTKYSHFHVSGEDDNYRLSLRGYSGNTGFDDMALRPSDRWSQTGQQFTTYDRDNDNNPTGNCALLFGGGGFWHNNCFAFNANIVHSGIKEGRSVGGPPWVRRQAWNYSMKSVEMKFRAVK